MSETHEDIHGNARIEKIRYDESRYDAEILHQMEMSDEAERRWNIFAIIGGIITFIGFLMFMFQVDDTTMSAFEMLVICWHTPLLFGLVWCIVGLFFADKAGGG